MSGGIAAFLRPEYALGDRFMKTRQQIYGQEAASILRDVTMYRALKEEQLLRLYAHHKNHAFVCL